MRQLITRIDDDLHRRLKERAAAEGRSVNALVNDALREALAKDDERARIDARIRAAGLLVRPRRPRKVPPLDKVIAATKGAGRAVSEALEEDRRAR